MRIALLHYHLNTGGVAQVIRQQATVLTDLGHEVLLLTGAPSPSDLHFHCQVIEGLGYDHGSTGGIPSVSSDTIVSRIIQAMTLKWPQPPDILHVHNPILAKNRQLLHVLRQLQLLNISVLCQVHDFAEDGRPAAFFREEYPSDCHYAVINHRDYDILERAGLQPNGLHYLPNPVTPWPAPSPEPAPDPAPSLNNKPIIYPVRAIRRKNIGEAILLHLFRPNQQPLLITLPPTSDQDLPAYKFWKTFVDDHGLNIVFEAGISTDFKQLTSQCAHVLTTSITEGFGFAFLESWTAHKPLLGRLLPDICRDFIENGLDLAHLYEKLLIPLDWLDHEGLNTIWSETMDQAASALQLALSEESIARGWAHITQGGVIDFGLLEESYQQGVIRILMDDPRACNRLCDLNPFLNAMDRASYDTTAIDHNRRIILANYNLTAYGCNLIRVYGRVAGKKIIQRINKRCVAESFFTPQTFSLLKWRPFNG